MREPFGEFLGRPWALLARLLALPRGISWVPEPRGRSGRKLEKETFCGRCLVDVGIPLFYIVSCLFGASPALLFEVFWVVFWIVFPLSFVVLNFVRHKKGGHAWHSEKKTTDVHVVFLAKAAALRQEGR